MATLVSRDGAPHGVVLSSTLLDGVERPLVTFQPNPGVIYNMEAVPVGHGLTKRVVGLGQYVELEIVVMPIGEADIWKAAGMSSIFVWTPPALVLPCPVLAIRFQAVAGGSPNDSELLLLTEHVVSTVSRGTSSRIATTSARGELRAPGC